MTHTFFKPAPRDDIDVLWQFHEIAREVSREFAAEFSDVFHNFYHGKSMQVTRISIAADRRQLQDLATLCDALLPTYDQIKGRVVAATEKLPVTYLGVELRNAFKAVDLDQHPHPEWVRRIHGHIREVLVDFTVICDALLPPEDNGEQ